MQEIFVYWFYILWLYWIHWLVITVFWWGLQFSVYNMPSANGDSFTSSFLNWMTFISFYCLIALARTSITMLNKSDENGQSCLVPDLRGKAFSFPLLSMMLPVGLSYMAFIMLRYIHYIPTVLRVSQFLIIYHRHFPPLIL